MAYAFDVIREEMIGSGDEHTCAKGRIKRTGEGLDAHAVGLLVEEAATAALGLGTARDRGRRVNSLVVTVGADDNNFKSALSLAHV
jgi:hypothetical protein